jgi:hypothetical protein
VFRGGQFRGFGENCDGVAVTLDESPDGKIVCGPLRQDLKSTPRLTRTWQREHFDVRTNKFL